MYGAKIQDLPDIYKDSADAIERDFQAISDINRQDEPPGAGGCGDGDRPGLWQGVAHCEELHWNELVSLRAAGLCDYGRYHGESLQRQSRFSS